MIDAPVCDDGGLDSLHSMHYNMLSTLLRNIAILIMIMCKMMQTLPIFRVLTIVLARVNLFVHNIIMRRAPLRNTPMHNIAHHKMHACIWHGTLLSLRVRSLPTGTRLVLTCALGQQSRPVLGPTARSRTDVDAVLYCARRHDRHGFVPRLRAAG